ncbi:hypothetical protein ACHAXM_001467, partial [Skeletonema potamos]
MSSRRSSLLSSRRASFREQLNEQRRLSTRTLTLPSTIQERLTIAEQVGNETDYVTQPFNSQFQPTEMRQLALVAHNHMKPAMKQFIETYSEVLKKFRITGTQTTMKMCKSMWGEDDPSINYGLTCTSGPLGGDAQIAALMCMEDLGGIIFFVDPLSAHPHQADIDSLIRLANCGNIILCPNPASASSMMHTLRCALIKGSRGMIPSFFETLESPAVEEYKHQQAVALANVIRGNSPSGGAVAQDPPKEDEKKVVDEEQAQEGSRRAVSFNDDNVEEDAEEKKTKKAVAEISETVIHRALDGQSIMCASRLEALLMLESDEDESDDNSDMVDAAPAAKLTKVSSGLFGIKTGTTKR